MTGTLVPSLQPLPCPAHGLSFLISQMGGGAVPAVCLGQRTDWLEWVEHGLNPGFYTSQLGEVGKITLLYKLWPIGNNQMK